jgi:predicted nucleic acid-binding protein
MKKRFVLDAWSVLALLQKEEPAASRVRELLDRASCGEIELSMSIINLGEVIYRVARVKNEEEAEETLHQIRRLPLVLLPAIEDAVFTAARFKMRYAISYADAFAAAAAASLEAVLVTGDPELEQLRGAIQIEKLERAAQARR